MWVKWSGKALTLAALLAVALPAADGIPAHDQGRRNAGVGEAWGGRHPEAAEVAGILRRLRKRLEKEGNEAKEQGHLDVALECNEEIGQVGEIWKILEEINGATIPLEEENPEL